LLHQQRLRFHFDRSGLIAVIATNSADVGCWHQGAQHVSAPARRLFTRNRTSINQGAAGASDPNATSGESENQTIVKPIADVGASGDDKGMGGKYLILPPGFEGTVPDGYIVKQNDTFSVAFTLLFGRSPRTAEHTKTKRHTHKHSSGTRW
jgi:hypothetical protein